MSMYQKSSVLTKEQAGAQRNWFVVDLNEQILGRVATRIATVLRGKHKPAYTPNQDCGDFVVVVNASKLKLSGQKSLQKKYRYHTGYIGHLRETTAEKMQAEKPEEMVRKAVWGMMPKGVLGRQMMRKLKIYSGQEHEHGAQQPKALAF